MMRTPVVPALRPELAGTVVIKAQTMQPTPLNSDNDYYNQ